MSVPHTNKLYGGFCTIICHSNLMQQHAFPCMDTQVITQVF